MLFISQWRGIILIVCSILVMTSCGGKPDRPPEGAENVHCVITSHTNGQRADKNTTLKGTVDGMQSGWDLYAYTRARTTEDQPYWLSARKAVRNGNNWSIDVVLGQDDTSSGTGYTVAIVIPNGEPQGPTVKDLPKSVQQCGTVELVRK